MDLDQRQCAATLISARVRGGRARRRLGAVILLQCFVRGSLTRWRAKAARAALAIQASLRGLCLRRRLAAVIRVQAYGRRQRAQRERLAELASLFHSDITRAAWSDARVSNLGEATAAVQHLRTQLAATEPGRPAPASIVRRLAQARALLTSDEPNTGAAGKSQSVAQRLDQARALLRAAPAAGVEKEGDAHFDDVLSEAAWGSTVPTCADTGAAVPAVQLAPHDVAATEASRARAAGVVAVLRSREASNAPGVAVGALNTSSPSPDAAVGAASAEAFVASLQHAAAASAPRRLQAGAVAKERNLRDAARAWPATPDPTVRLRAAVATALSAAFCVASRGMLAAHLVAEASKGNRKLHWLIDVRESAMDDLFGESPLYQIGVKARVVQRMWRRRRRINAARRLLRVMRGTLWRSTVSCALAARQRTAAQRASAREAARAAAAAILQRAWRSRVARRTLRGALALAAEIEGRRRARVRIAAAVAVATRSSTAAMRRARCRAVWAVYRRLEDAKAERAVQVSRQQASALRDAVEHSRRRARFHEAQHAIGIARYAPTLSLLFAHYARASGTPTAAPLRMVYADLEALCSETGVLPLLVTPTRLARLFELCSALRGSGLLRPADLGACLAAVATTALTSIATPQARVNALFIALGLDNDVVDVRAFLRAAELLRGAGLVPAVASARRGEALAAALRCRSIAGVAPSRDALPPLRDANASPSRRRKPGHCPARIAIADIIDAGSACTVEIAEPTALALCEDARAALRRFERETLRVRLSHDADTLEIGDVRPESPLRAAHSHRRCVLESIALGIL